MQILTIDWSDRAEFERFHELVLKVQRAESEFPTAMGVDEWRVLFGPDSNDRRCSARVAVLDDGTWVGALALEEQLLENTDKLELAIYVDPEHRRRGIGSALLACAEEYARSVGRTMLWAEVEAPYDGSMVWSSGTAFAERHGFARKHLELHQILRLPIAGAELDRLMPELSGYRIVQWEATCPDEWVDQFCALLSMFGDEVPLGELEIEAATWTPERLRATEARRRAQGRFGCTAVAVAPDGTLAGYTEMGGSAGTPGRLYQRGTMVRPEHRGHRLGMALKIPNLRALQALVGGPAVLHTWNAPENGPMIAVNENLGFKPFQNLCEYQRPL